MAESEIPEDIMDVAFHLTAGDWNQPHDVRAKKVAAAIYAERARANKDAERYRWLRDGNAYVPEEQMCTGGEYLDEICDEGIAAIRQDNPNET
jgi:hypothetical protein